MNICFFFFKMLLKKFMTSMLELEMTKTRSRFVLPLQEKFDIFLLEFQVSQKIANNTSGSSKANCPGFKFNPVDF